MGFLASIGTALAAAAPTLSALSSVATAGVAIGSAADKPSGPKAPQAPVDPRIAAQKQQDARRRRMAEGGRQSTIKSSPLGRSGRGASYGARQQPLSAQKTLTGQ